MGDSYVALPRTQQCLPSFFIRNGGEMKITISFILLAAILLTACRPAVNEAIVNSGDDFIRQFGDDVVQIAINSGDDVARQSTKYSDDVLNYWDDIMRQAPRTVEKVPSPLIYNTASHLYPEEVYVLEELQTELSLSANEAALYLQGACSIASWVSLVGNYPPKDFTENYVRSVADQNGIRIFSIIDFVQSIVAFSIAIIDDPSFDSRQAGAKIMFDALCMVAE
jgi:hypothetical protein